MARYAVQSCRVRVGSGSCVREGGTRYETVTTSSYRGRSVTTEPSHGETRGCVRGLRSEGRVRVRFDSSSLERTEAMQEHAGPIGSRQGDHSIV